MAANDCSRRDFLKKFAYLSAGTLVLSTTTLACYGPAPGNYPNVSVPVVSGIFYLDADGRTVSLRNAVAVPLQTKFSIEFTEDMNTSAPPTVLLSAGNLSVGVDSGTWDTVRVFSLAPVTALSPNTPYTLSVEDATDGGGDKLAVTDASKALFTTGTA